MSVEAERPPADTGRTPRGAGGSRGLVAVCVLLTLALRAPFVPRALLPDEAGLLLVARNWGEGPFLYGEYWVDRPVLVVQLFRLADLLPSDAGVRLLGCVTAATMVVVAGWAGHGLRGRPGAWWGALVAAALSSSYAFSAESMNGKLLAAGVVLTSCACTLAAVRQPRPRRQALLAGLAGVLASSAVLVQQSFVEAIAFAAVLVLAAWRAQVLSGAGAVRTTLAGAAGLLMPVAALVLWVASTPKTFGQLWFVTFGYRFEASEVINSGGLDEPLTRLAVVLALAAVAGVLWLLWALIRGRREVMAEGRFVAPTYLATGVMLVVMVASMAAGGSWWRDYLIQLIPVLVLAAALVAPLPTTAGRRMRQGVVLAVVTAVVATGVGIQRPVLGDGSQESAIGGWLAASARSGDTAVVTFSHANVLEAAGMTSPYPYLWSLPVRTLDPELTRLVGTLEGTDAPTWVVEWNAIESWDLDASGDLAETIDSRYERVATVCGHDVYLLRGTVRALPATPSCPPEGIS